jgi:nicotinamide riboside transporter PnuC
MQREQWFVWIAAAIILTMVLAAIGYMALAALSQASATAGGAAATAAGL